MIGLIEVHIVAAGLGHGSAQFGIAQSTHQRDQAAQNPDDEGQAHVHAAALEDIAAQVENARADHDSADDAHASEKADLPAEAASFVGDGGVLVLTAHFVSSLSFLRIFPPTGNKKDCIYRCSLKQQENTSIAPLSQRQESW